MSCMQCQGDRIMFISGKCSDMCFASFGEAKHNGYVPGGVGVDDGGDYLQFEICLECGQVQDDWPKPDPGFASPSASDTGK